MRVEPAVKRTVAFFDGQNLFHTAKQVFGYRFPNFDPGLLAESIAKCHGWVLVETRFYTGVPDAVDSAFWNHFWNAKLAVMGTRGIKSYRRPLKYRDKTIALPSGGSSVVRVGQEKGIDIRIALDMVRLAHRNVYDVAILFSQDQDLSEAADEVRDIAIEQNRWIKIASAFPDSPTSANRRGINKPTGSELIRPLMMRASTRTTIARKPLSVVSPSFEISA